MDGGQGLSVVSLYSWKCPPLHVLCECFFTFWRRLNTFSNTQSFFDGSLSCWVKHNLQKGTFMVFHQVPWMVVLAMGLWQLSTHPNSQIFDPQQTTISTLIRDTHHQSLSCVYMGGQGVLKTPAPRCINFIQWYRPPEVMLKISCDGSIHAANGTRGVAAIIRYAQANWICASSPKLLGVDIMAAELGLLRMV